MSLPLYIPQSLSSLRFVLLFELKTFHIVSSVAFPDADLVSWRAVSAAILARRASSVASFASTAAFCASGSLVDAFARFNTFAASLYADFASFAAFCVFLEAILDLRRDWTASLKSVSAGVAFLASSMTFSAAETAFSADEANLTASADALEAFEAYDFALWISGSIWGMIRRSDCFRLTSRWVVLVY